EKGPIVDLVNDFEKNRADFIAIEETLKQQSQSLQEEINTKNSVVENLHKDFKQLLIEYQNVTEENVSFCSKVGDLEYNCNELKEALTLKENKLTLIEEENKKLNSQITEQDNHIKKIL
ncbi:hypothetical protein Avbf_02868, partial [Armadillidium vulgare]